MGLNPPDLNSPDLNPPGFNQMASGRIDPAAIKAKALETGFDAFGVAPVRVAEINRQRLRQFISAGEHGTMSWMEKRLEERADPQTLWPDVRSIIVLGMNYGPDQNPLQRLAQKHRANVSVYAENRDYHDLVKKRLKQLGRWLVGETGCEIKVFVDTAPVLEKAIAGLSGVGWQGKHTNLVSRDFGSWLFLGEIFTTLDLALSEPVADHCGSCTSCIDICPTQAITAPYRLDARACISYLTIEHEGPIPLRYRDAIGNRIYGCDDCLAVCPWNKFASRHEKPEFAVREVLKNPQTADFLTYDEAAFRSAFRGGPVRRIGINRFLRNVATAAGNSGDPNLIPALQNLGKRKPPVDPSVTDAVNWAVCKLSKT